MDTYTASNGMTVERDHNGDVVIDKGTEHVSVFMGDGTALALREFFQTEADKHLGRWRWDENPDWVMYPDEDGDLVVLNETIGRVYECVTRLGVKNYPQHPSSAPARAYFDAHPEQHAWDAAKDGEVWVMTRGDRPEMVTRVECSSGFPRFIDIEDDMGYGPRSGFTAGRRIWPEEDPS